jgi:hypothetical protein
VPDSAHVVSHMQPDEQSYAAQDMIQSGLRILAKLIAAQVQADRQAHAAEELFSHHIRDGMPSETCNE